MSAKITNVVVSEKMEKGWGETQVFVINDSRGIEQRCVADISAACFVP